MNRTARRRGLAVFVFPAILVLAGGVGAVAWLGAGSGESMSGEGETVGLISVTVRVRYGAAGKATVDAAVRVPEGSSVLDATKAIGVPVTTSEEAAGESCCGAGMIHAIDGVASSAVTRSGWMYSVNGMPPPLGPASMRLASGDVVEWTYR